MFAASLDTVRLDDPAVVVSARRARLDAGRAFLDSLSPDRLRLLVGRRQWYRHYLPPRVTGRGADTELGYYVVEFAEGPLGAIDPNRDPARYDPSERVAGLLVSVRGHYLEGTAGLTYDSEALYWVAWDRSEEAWSIRGTRRAGRATQSEAQTGIRTRRSTSDPAGTITVIASRLDGTTRDQQSWRVPDVYLSQATRWALGALLPRDVGPSNEPHTFGMYCFDATSTELAVSLRTDTWEPLDASRSRWRLTSQARGDAPKVVSIHDAAGRLRRRTWPNGAVAEATELEALQRRWRPLGSVPALRDR